VILLCVDFSGSYRMLYVFILRTIIKPVTINCFMDNTYKERVLDICADVCPLTYISRESSYFSTCQNIADQFVKEKIECIDYSNALLTRPPFYVNQEIANTQNHLSQRLKDSFKEKITMKINELPQSIIGKNLLLKSLSNPTLDQWC